MIKLEKGDEPAALSKNCTRWTEIVVRKITAGDAPTKSEKSRYNHRDIKQALLLETFDKCAYCESKLRHITFGDIEHVVPKSDDPSKWFSWPNLTIACDVCNTNKGGASVDGGTFIDPYQVDPEEHFWQLGAVVYARPGCDAAALTERLLKLNRADLVERRGERIKRLMKMLEVIERCENGELKELLWREFTSEGETHNEYAALSRTVIEVAERGLGAA
ncbi:HNH endonuclease [Candidatus Palauibacter sp.]|uniref:HNH endonuclease n=1 Tax=Candidatus Palauibacter sp. TaxID=3101350 RepID=UPI003C6FA7BC